jgi:transcriptional regulator with XRE-family HTH domain
MKLPNNASVTQTVLADFERRCSDAKTSIAAVLSKAGVNESTWWRWKTEKSSPTLSTLNRLGRVLDEIENAAEAA